MKKNILLTCLCLVFSFAILSLPKDGFAQTVDWARAEAYPSYVTWTGIVIHDNLGNTFISGEYSSIGGGYFIIKYDINGNKVWEKKDYVCVTSMCTDNSGNLYAIMFAPKVEGVNYYTKNGSLFAKYDTNGNLVWIKQINLNVRFSERTDANNNIIATGAVVAEFKDTVNLENGITLTAPPGGVRFFIAHFNTNGECVWAIQDEGSLHPLICNQNGDMCVSELNDQAVLAKYASNGDLAWAKQANSYCAALDGAGNIYSFNGDNTNGNVAYLVKYDINGNILWKRTYLYINDWYKFAMKCDANGNVFITGGFANSMTIADTTINSNGNYHTFVAKIDSAGKLKWVIINSGSGWSGAKDITVNGNEIYVTGDMGGTITLGGTSIAQPAGGVFVAKIIDNDVTQITNPIKTDDVFTVYPNPTGNIFYINYTTSQSVSDLTLEIKNVTGQTIYTKQYKSFNKEMKDEIDLGKQAKGIYFLEIIADRKRTVRKIVLE